MREMLAAVALVIFVPLMLVVGATWYFSVPLVHRSTRTGDCVKVEHPSRDYDCESVPQWPQVTVWVR